MNSWSYALMILSALLLWGLLVTVIVLAVRQASRSARTGPAAGSASPTAEELLAQRFARGEIDAEQYHADLRILRERHDHPLAT
ncbi:hypothetical protein [Nonomuraea maheshkhaliensis]